MELDTERPKNTSKSLVLRIKALGDYSNSIILQVSMCYFTKSKVLDSITINIDAIDQKAYGSVVDSDYLDWWKSEDNIQEYKTFWKNNHNVEDALDFIDWFILPDTKVYCFSTYDYRILKNLYERTFRDFPVKDDCIKDISCLYNIQCNPLDTTSTLEDCVQLSRKIK